MYIHITLQDGYSSTKKKDLAFKASQDKRGKAKVDHDSNGDDNASDDENGSDSDEEFESPSYDNLVKLLNQYTNIIRKTRAKNDKLELVNDSLLAKYNIAKKN